LLDDLKAADVSRFEAALLRHFRDQHPGMLEELTKTGEMSNELAERIKQVVRDFKTQFK